MKIKECMCPDVCFVRPDCNVYDAARIMNENHIGCIPVCNEEKYIVGILTDRDIVLRGVACDKNSRVTKVSEIMSTDVYTCKLNQTVEDAECIMAEKQIRRIPVTNEQNQMVGILTMGDLSKNSENIGSENFTKTVENICNCTGNVKNCG